MPTKSVVKKEIGSNENWKFIAPLNKKKDFRYEPINEILDISHEHLTVETKNFAGTPRKKGEKIVYQNKFKEKYGIVDWGGDDSPDAVKDDEDQLKTMNDTFSDDNKQLMHVQTL